MGFIQIVSEGRTIEECPLDKALFIGRAETCDFRLVHPRISRVHCVVMRIGDAAALLSDLGSKNGTYVDGEEISKTMLHDGQTFAVGRVTFRFRAGDSASLPSSRQLPLSIEQTHPIDEPEGDSK